MRTIILFDSLHGSTEKCAHMLDQFINSEIQITSLKGNEEISIELFDIVIIGGSIHMGVIQTRVENFIKKNHSQLLKKKLGLYLCCMEEGETALRQFEKAYPEDLRKKAIASGLFGGEFNLRKMNFFERKLTRRITGIKNSVSKINEEEIQKFSKMIMSSFTIENK